MLLMLPGSINLLNCNYELLAWVLVQRLTPAADAVVDQCQTVFLPGRWIGDNVLHYLEEVHYCESESVPECLIFLDLEKAYDRLDRGWLLMCMERLGSPPVALRWVLLVLAGTRAVGAGRHTGWCDVSWQPVTWA
jgi:hypothetical protein